MSEKLYNSYRPLTTDPTKYPDLQRVFLGLGPIMEVSKEAEQMNEIIAKPPPEKTSTVEPDPIYERGLKAEESLINFIKNAAKEPGKSPSRGVFGSFRPERAIRSWYENNPDLAKDYNAANIQIGNASNQKEIIEKLSENINNSQPFGSLGKETINEDFRLLTPIPKATGGISQISTEAPAGPPSGVIETENATPSETVADDIPMDVPEGSFIINAAAAEVAGYGDIKTMLMDAIGVARRLGVEISTGDDKIGDEEAVDLLVSKGEVYIEPTLAKIIGYDVLEKINNRGKREVARRQQEAEAKQQPPQAPPQQGPQKTVYGGMTRKEFDNLRETGAKALQVYDESERAKELSEAVREEKQFKDNDRSEDTLRHILLGGLISPANQKGLLKKGLGFIAGIGADALEKQYSLENPLGEFPNEESRIDANNNNYGAALRKQYKTQEEFEKAAIQVVLNLREGKPVKKINGLTPRLSLGN